MDIAIMIEGQDGLNWERWKRHARMAEDLGFAGLYRSDHFANADGPHLDALELWISLAYLAAETKRIEFGPMVSPVSFRNPVVTAWSAGAVDDLSGGRLHLGLGAGWNVREHAEFGFPLLDLDPRFQRYEEGVQVILTLLRSDEPAAFSGDFYQLDNALMLPRPARRVPIVIGGNGPLRTLPLVAKYADEWNAVYATPQKVRELSAKLDELLANEGREPSDVRRTLMHRVIIGKNEAQLKSKLDGLDVDDLRERAVIFGTPSDVVEQIGAFAEAGIVRLMAQWLDQDDVEGLELLATEVLPQLN
ncbi:MAG: TIGR03560 family F420-dependent LLM class oxidoreductase [Thermomicrobiales bacterium]|nr:TIGR03560 family F420-dependent LLM class oxidoreductase [Thermomicrobiales bacterium]